MTDNKKSAIFVISTELRAELEEYSTTVLVTERVANILTNYTEGVHYFYTNLWLGGTIE